MINQSLIGRSNDGADADRKQCVDALINEIYVKVAAFDHRL